MYYYIYDEFVQDKRFEKELFQIENRLTDLGISGKIGRLALFKDAAELIRDEARRGAKTVIFVGNDRTINRALKILPELKVTFGILPMGEEENTYAKILGMPQGFAACDVISARIIRPMDMAKVNDRFFLSRISIPNARVPLLCEGSYRLAPTDAGDIEIRNWGWMDKSQNCVGNPEDGLLDLIIEAKLGKKKAGSTDLKLKFIDIRVKEQISIHIDGERVNGNNFKIKIAPAKVRWIVGKERLF